MKTVGIIPDGNRRYAKKHGIGLEEAYEKAIKVMEKTIKFFYTRANVKYFIIYGLSSDNFRKRKEEELYPYLRTVLRFYREHKDYNVKFIGNIKELPEWFKRYINTGRYRLRFPEIYVLFNYSSKEDIKGCKEKRRLLLEQVPDVDILIRTSERRISGFVPYKLDYAEFFFIDKLWPEITERDLMEVVVDFLSRERRFGK